MAELKIYRGADRIGGGCTEITAGGKRILIDFGANLPDTDTPISDDELAAQVFDGRPAVGLLFTHTHGDHIGLYKKVPPGVDMYVGPLAKEILRVLTARLDSAAEKKGGPIVEAKGGPIVEGMRTYQAGKWLELAPEISVLPLYVDHSALDAYMLYINAAGKKLLFTGDFRDHGIQGERGQLWAALNRYVVPYGVDVLVTEGTMLNRLEETRKNPVQTERALGLAALRRFRQHKYNFVLMSSTNLDSLMQFYHRTPRGMCFVCDSYQAQVMLTAMKGMENREPYWYRRSRYQPRIYIWRSSEDEDLSALERLGASLTLPLEIRPANAGLMGRNGFVMLVRKSLPRRHQAAMKHFFTQNGGRDSYLTYSMWTGYLKGGAHPDQEMLDKLGGIEPHPLHTSGHAYVDTIARLIETVKPKRIVPMHTECAKEFKDFPEFARWSGQVRPLDNGEPLPLDEL